MEIDHYFFFSEKKIIIPSVNVKGCQKNFLNFFLPPGAGRILLTWPDPSPDNPR
jgi:hypothetical protein